MNRQRRRLALALLVSLLIHAVLFSLTYSGQGSGLPGFGLPWQQRRIEAPDLHIVLVPAPDASAEPAIASVAEPPQQASIEQPVASRPVPAPRPSPAPARGKTAVPSAPVAKPTAEARAKKKAAAGAAAARKPLRTDKPGHAARTRVREPVVTGVEPSGGAASDVPAAASASTPVIAAAPDASRPETVMPATRDATEVARKGIDPQARERAFAAARLDSSEREAERRAAEQLEAQRQEEARREAARLEAERQEAARRAAEQLEAQRKEEARR
ncbi:MAG: hypothetical protein JSW31_10950, partial [Burkholderiales bacterium]